MWNEIWSIYWLKAKYTSEFVKIYDIPCAYNNISIFHKALRPRPTKFNFCFSSSVVTVNCYFLLHGNHTKMISI